MRGQSEPRRRERLRSARTFPAGLATCAVVGLVVGVTDALDLFAASWAGLAEASVNGHVFAEGGDFFGEACVCFGVQAVDPELKGFASGCVESLPFFRFELVGLRDGRELRCVKDLVGVGVADAAEDAGIGEGSLEGAVFGGERVAEGLEVA